MKASTAVVTVVTNPFACASHRRIGACVGSSEQSLGRWRQLVRRLRREICEATARVEARSGGARRAVATPEFPVADWASCPDRSSSPLPPDRSLFPAVAVERRCQRRSSGQAGRGGWGHLQRGHAPAPARLGSSFVVHADLPWVAGPSPTPLQGHGTGVRLGQQSTVGLHTMARMRMINFEYM